MNSPVDTPQLRRQAMFGGIARSILVMLAMSTTVYSLKLDTYRKWWMSCPLRSVNLLDSCLGIEGETLNGNLEQRLLLFDLQSTHSLQSGKKVGITISPSVTSSTSSPMLSTTLQHINFGFQKYQLSPKYNKKHNSLILIWCGVL